ncbi:MAG: hypothetical protein QXD61_11820 [Candidatus Caldarchaeum sp.]
MSVSKFNQVENGLKAKVEAVYGVGKVFIGEYAAPQLFPRAEIFATEVRTEEKTIKGGKLTHFWTFAVELWALGGDAREIYADIKNKFWSIYDQLMADRTLGAGADVWATPSAGDLSSAPTGDGQYGFRWLMRVVVRVSEL